MQDKVNYRFWDTKEHVMLDWDCICQTAFNCTRKEGNEIQRYGLMYFVFTTPQRFIPLECTGLRDKNGKIIFEGDIVDCYVSTKKLYRYQVKYEIGSFMLVSPYEEIFDFKNKWNDNVYPLSQLYFEYNNEEDCIWHCEVISNIYENPEVLEEKDANI